LPIGRRWAALATLDELAGPVLLLASEAGSYITGACPVVDGGTIVKTM
jgi:hypothetical protein